MNKVAKIDTILYTVKPLMEDMLKEDKPLNKGQSESTFVRSYMKNNFSTKDEKLSPKCVQDTL